MFIGGNNDALSRARDLLRLPLVTPATSGALGVLETIPDGCRFSMCIASPQPEPGTQPIIDNLYARNRQTCLRISRLVAGIPTCGRRS